MTKVLLAGLGKSNSSALEFLKRAGFDVYTYDDRVKADYNYARLKKELPVFDFVLLSPGIKSTSRVYSLLRLLSKHVINDLTLFLYINNKRFKTIAITGSNGKSTTAMMLYEALKYLGKKVLLAGNIGNEVMNENNIGEDFDYLILEISSYQAMNFYGNLEVLIITPISPNHLDSYHNYKEYLASKKRLALFTNNIVCDVKTKKTLGLEKSFYSENIAINDMHSYDFNLVLNAINLLNLEVEGLKDFDYQRISLVSRYEKFYAYKNSVFIDDSKSTSFQATEQALKESEEETILILGGHLKSSTSNKIKAAVVIIYGEDKKKFIKYIDSNSYVIEVNHLKDGIEIIKSLCEKKDYRVLFSPAGSSLEYSNFIKRGEDFKRMIRESYEL